MARKVLILGGNGFMGRWLVTHLRALGDHVDAPGRDEANMRDAGALRAVVKAAAPDIVINLAGLSSVTHGDAEALYDINTLGHLRLLQAVQSEAPSARVFLASSANVYGNGEEGSAFRETDTPAPRNHYALSKMAAEQLHTVFAPMTLCSVRPFNCIGRGQSLTFFVAKLVDAFRRRAPEVQAGNMDVRRDFIDVRDVCAMWARVLAAPTPPSVVNFGNGEAVALTKIVQETERISGHSARIVSSSQLARPADLSYQRADIGVISGLGYQRRYTLAETLAWMMEEGRPDEA